MHGEVKKVVCRIVSFSKAISSTLHFRSFVFPMAGLRASRKAYNVFFHLDHCHQKTCKALGSSSHFEKGIGQLCSYRPLMTIATFNLSNIAIGDQKKAESAFCAQKVPSVQLPRQLSQTMESTFFAHFGGEAADIFPHLRGWLALFWSMGMGIFVINYPLVTRNQ